MSFKGLTWPAVAMLGILAAALGSGIPSRAAAQTVSYPWCTQEEELHCYYATRQQCEETVDYHGFCVNNPDYSSGDSNPTRRARPH